MTGPTLLLALAPSGAGADGLGPATAIGWAEVGGAAGRFAPDDRGGVAARLAAASLVVVEDGLFDPPRLAVLLGGSEAGSARALPVMRDWIAQLGRVGAAHRLPELLAAHLLSGADPLDRALTMRDLLLSAGAL